VSLSSFSRNTKAFTKERLKFAFSLADDEPLDEATKSLIEFVCPQDLVKKPKILIG